MKTTPSRTVISSVFMLGSLFANFILTFAASYAGRCAWPSLVWLTIAVAALLTAVPENTQSGSAVSPGGGFYKAAAKNAPLILTLMLLPFTLYAVVFGVYDVYRTGRDMRVNTAVIESCRDSGIMDVEVRYVYPSTKYSAIYDLKYLDTETPFIWPNENMATYFGIDSITALP